MNSYTEVNIIKPCIESALIDLDTDITRFERKKTKLIMHITSSWGMNVNHSSSNSIGMDTAQCGQIIHKGSQ